MIELTYAQAIAKALDEEMERDEDVILMGEDVGFIGGNFKTSVGLFEKYGPWRVKDSPISELGIAGMGVGMALAGIRPVIELMYSDFALLASDQIVNQAAKIRYMSGGQAIVPVTYRMPLGAGRSSAAQHSQSMQAMLSHFPGLLIAIPSTAQEAMGLLKAAIRNDNPVVVFEPKMEYNKKYMVDEVVEPIELGKARIAREGRDITIVATSSLVMKSEAAAERLEAEGISCEVIDLRTIVPLDRDTIISSVKKTGKMIVADESYSFCGVCHGIIADLHADIFYYLDAPCGSVDTPKVPIPYSPALEYFIIPSEDKVYEKVKSYFI
jgi:pyruvate dehydrogenase E1 component beta subunit